MKKFKDWLIKDWWLKIVSLVLAFLLWFVVVQIDNPTDSVTFKNVSVTLLGQEALDDANLVYDVLDNSDKVTVTITAPKSVTDSLSIDDLLVTADLNERGEDNKLKINYDIMTSATVDSIEGNRDYVSVSIEEKVRKYVSLNVKTVGTVADGYVLGDITLDQNMIEISGPQSQVSQVKSAGITVDVNGISSSLSANIEINLYSANGNLLNLSAVTKQTNYVHVSADVLTIKTVSVVATKSGIPAEGYLYSNVLSVSPSTVKIAGTAADLAGLSKIVITEPIDLTGAEENVAETYDITAYLPDGIRLADKDADPIVSVEASIEEAKTQVFNVPIENITLTNVPKDAVAYISSYQKYMTVILSGLESELAGVTPESIKGTIDVEAYLKENEIVEYMSSAYLVPIELELSGSLSLTTEVKLTIVISKAPEN